MATERNQGNKNPIYKKWWFWGILVLLAVVLANNGSMNKDQSNTGNNAANNTTPGAEDAKNQVSPTVTVQISPTQSAALTRDNSSAILTTLNTGTFIVSTDIPAGRYTITGDGNGNFFVYNASAEAYINEILGGGDIGVDSVTTDIKDGDSIEISGINNVIFTPAQTILYTDTLTTGNWYVGLDIAPARYDISSNGNGNLFVYDTSGQSVVNEILGGGDIGVDKVTATLKTGYMITISGMKQINLLKK